MAVVIEFKLTDLINAVIANNNYNMTLNIEEKEARSGWSLDEDGHKVWEETPAERLYKASITAPNKQKYSFDMTIENDTGVYFWLVDSQYNDDHINLLNELEVPYRKV